VKPVIYVDKTKVVGAGIHPVPIVCGRKILLVARKGGGVRVSVKLFANLTRFSSDVLPGVPFDIELSEAASIKDLVALLRIPTEETKISFVNGQIRDLDWILKHGDEVGIFPPIGGG
jgi:sulfur-carrier protein